MKPTSVSSFLLALAFSTRLGSSSPVSYRSTGHTDDQDGIPQAPLNLPDPVPETNGHPDEETDYRRPTIPDWPTTHLLARRLLAVSTTGVLSTVYPKNHRDPSLAGSPVGLPDYIADCANEDDPELAELIGSGNPLILALNIGTTFRNTNAGSNISLSIDWWHHQQSEPKNGGDDLDRSLAALPRLSLIGRLEALPVKLPDTTIKAIEKCFLKAHPDASYWLPGHRDAAHRGYWARLDVEKALWIGGFGDRARIGWLDPQAFKDLQKHGKDGEKGWDDVKLPGEH